MKIRIDFVTNSSSSSFVTYRLKNSEFCKYLTEQMQKNGFTYETWSDDRPASEVSIDSDSLYANISCPREGLICDDFAPEVRDPEEYEEVYREDLVSEDKFVMKRKFLDILGEFVPFEYVDEPEKLFDAFMKDILNDRLECDVHLGSTD